MQPFMLERYQYEETADGTAPWCDRCLRRDVKTVFPGGVVQLGRLSLSVCRDMTDGTYLCTDCVQSIFDVEREKAAAA